jgi:pimeloyl-ACP methyl ester carboxylesterase
MLEVIGKGSSTDSHPMPLLFVHGACSTAWVWDEHFLDFFADKGYRAVALSLRGHGASSLSKPLKSCSIADYVEDVHAVVGKLGSPPVLIGHSLRCRVPQRGSSSPRARHRDYDDGHSVLLSVIHGLFCVATPSVARPIYLTLRLWPVNSCSPRKPQNLSSRPVRPVWSPKAHALHEKRSADSPMLAV